MHISIHPLTVCNCIRQTTTIPLAQDVGVVGVPCHPTDPDTPTVLPTSP